MAVGPTVKKIMNSYPGQVRLVVKNFPYQYRDYSHIAAAAALAARDQGKYWEMHDLLIKKSPKLDQQSLLGYARELGLDMTRFTADLNSPKHAQEIAQDKKLAADMDLYNTPTFFINGKRLIGERPFEYFKTIIDQELLHAKR